MNDNYDTIKKSIEIDAELYDKFKSILNDKGHQTSGRHSELSKILEGIIDEKLKFYVKEYENVKSDRIEDAEFKKLISRDK